MMVRENLENKAISVIWSISVLLSIFWVYFDQILSLNTPQNYHFEIKK